MDHATSFPLSDPYLEPADTHHVHKLTDKKRSERTRNDQVDGCAVDELRVDEVEAMLLGRAGTKV